MENKMKILGDLRFKILIGLSLLLTIWWVALFLHARETTSYHLVWAASYQALAFLGGAWGVIISRQWGGFKSIMGKAVMGFSVGLLLQTFGQSVFSYYNLFLTVDIPYPSIADIGFFGSIPAYIYGVIYLARAAGVAVSLKSFANKLQALLIPLAILLVSYFFFLRGYEFVDVAPLQVFFDFGYPLGQAVYISIAVLAFLLSKKVLGGIMKFKISLIIFALVVQYAADYNFLYQAYNESWYNGGYGDYIYLLAYLLMGVSLLNLSIKYVRGD